MSRHMGSHVKVRVLLCLLFWECHLYGSMPHSRGLLRGILLTVCFPYKTESDSWYFVKNNNNDGNYEIFMLILVLDLTEV